MKKIDLKLPFSSAEAVAPSRAAQRLGVKYEDPGMQKAGQGLEQRTQAALDQGKSQLDVIN